MNNIIVMVFDSLSISTEKVLRNKAKKLSGFCCQHFYAVAMLLHWWFQGNGSVDSFATGQIFRIWIEELLLTVEDLEHIWMFQEHSLRLCQAESGSPRFKVAKSYFKCFVSWWSRHQSTGKNSGTHFISVSVFSSCIFVRHIKGNNMVLKVSIPK